MLFFSLVIKTSAQQPSADSHPVPPWEGPEGCSVFYPPSEQIPPDEGEMSSVPGRDLSSSWPLSLGWPWLLALWMPSSLVAGHLPAAFSLLLVVTRSQRSRLVLAEGWRAGLELSAPLWCPCGGVWESPWNRKHIGICPVKPEAGWCPRWVSCSLPVDRRRVRTCGASWPCALPEVLETFKASYSSANCVVPTCLEKK